jgi:hypothetical protein
MVVVAQQVRASVCGTEGRRFEPGLPPLKKLPEKEAFFLLIFWLKRGQFNTVYILFYYM